MPLTDAEIQAVADRVWAKVSRGVMPNGDPSPPHTAESWLTGAEIEGRDDASAAALAAAVVTIKAAVAAAGSSGATPTIDYDKLATALAAHLKITAV